MHSAEHVRKELKWTIHFLMLFITRCLSQELWFQFRRLVTAVVVTRNSRDFYMFQRFNFYLRQKIGKKEEKNRFFSILVAHIPRHNACLFTKGDSSIIIFLSSVINKMHGLINYHTFTKLVNPICTSVGETDYTTFVVF